MQTRRATPETTTGLPQRPVYIDRAGWNFNPGPIGFIRNYLDGFVVFERVVAGAAGQNAALPAGIRPREAGGPALSGHIYAVRADGQTCTGSPFTRRHQDGERMVRETCDLKRLVASCLAAATDLPAPGVPRPLHPLTNDDEGTDCGGVKRLMRDLDESGLRPSLCVVGEPSGMQPIPVQKGKLNLDITVRGPSGHFGGPAKGVNLVHAASKEVTSMAAEAIQLAAEGAFEDGFDPPHTTIHAGTIQGGSIPDIISDHAAFMIQRRPIAGDSPYRHPDRLRARIAGIIEPAACDRFTRGMADRLVV
nr:M20/M25/M40 family metallo-hydrolase [uncultured Rhodopila sp.]